MISDLRKRLKDAVQLSFFPEAKAREVIIKGAPSFMAPVRALFVSDVHLRKQASQKRVDQLIQTMRQTNADILLLGGDYGEGEDQCIRFFDALTALHFPMGVYAVPGNNDCYDRLEEILTSRGVTLLFNQEISMPVGKGILNIGGVDEPKYGHPDAKSILHNTEAYRILLSHFPIDNDCACDLQLSGHTHAGQWRIGSFTPYSILFEHKYRSRAVFGLHTLKDRQLFVGNGIGVSKLPLRINAEPEIYLLRFMN